jgi:hypothetical protein
MGKILVSIDFPRFSPIKKPAPLAPASPAVCEACREGNLSAVIGEMMTVAHLGVSENSIPLNPMVNDYYPY